MNSDGENIIKKTKIPSSLIIGYIVCVVLIIVSLGLINNKEKNQPTPIDFTTNGAIGMEAGKYAYLDVEGLSKEVAIYGNVDNENDESNDRYYIAISNGYWYIIDLNFETIDKLKDIQEYTYSTDANATKPETVKIYGVTEEISTELKKKIIDYYNEGLEDDEKIDESVFENYFGSVMLNVRKSPVDTTTEDLIIVFAGIGLIVLIIYHISISIVKKGVRKYLKDNQYEEELIDELNNNVEAKYYKGDVILTKNFFVNKKNGSLVIFKYSDVKWIYTSNLKYRGIITTSTSIIARLKDGKTNLQCISINGKETAEFSEVFKKICEKVSDECLKGYTVENEKEYKEYAKEIKRSGN